MLLVKLTAVTIGMVLTLNGAGRLLPQEGRMQERMQRQESCEVVPVMKKEQKIARTVRGGYDIMEQGAYGFNVSGQWTTGPGPDGIPWGIWFSASDAVLLVDVRPSVTEGRLFEEQWEKNKKALESAAREALGSELDTVRFYTQENDGGDMVYAMEYSCGREGRKWYVTVCYRFGENYIGEFIGVNPYSAMDCKEVTLDAARSLRELGKSGKRDLPEGTNKDGWPFPYLHNPFAITAYYMDEEVPPEPSEQRKASDYEIKWKDTGMETIMRSLRISKSSGT